MSSSNSTCAQDDAQAKTPAFSVILAFDLMQMTGVVCLCISLAIAMSTKNISRLATWYTFCISWIISALSYCLLLIFGGQWGSEPMHALCIFQGSLVYAAPILNIGNAIAFALHIYLKALNLTSSHSVGPSVRTERLLQVTPYVIWLIAVIAVLIALVPGTATVGRMNGIYCSSDSQIISRAVAAIVLAGSVVVIVMQGLTYHHIFSCGKIISDDERLLAMILRMSLFFLGSLLALGLCVSLLFLTSGSEAVFDLLLASFPLQVAVIFGCQPNILAGWLTKKSSQKQTRYDSLTHSTTK